MGLNIYVNTNNDNKNKDLFGHHFDLVLNTANKGDHILVDHPVEQPVDEEDGGQRGQTQEHDDANPMLHLFGALAEALCEVGKC